MTATTGISDNPIRSFTVSSEADIVATVDIEYRGGGWWRAELDDASPGRRETYASRSLRDVQRWADTTANEQAAKAVADCPCGTDGSDDPSGSGNFACGVMSPHGISISAFDGDGNDLTQDYLINGV